MANENNGLKLTATTLTEDYATNPDATPAITSFEIKYITFSSACITWTGSRAGIYYTLQLNDEEPFKIPAGETASWTFQHLTENTEYVVSIKPTNYEDAATTKIRFTTSKSYRDPEVTIPTFICVAEEVADRTATFRWTSLERDHVHYNLVENQTRVHKASGDDTTGVITISDLDPEVEYQMQFQKDNASTIEDILGNVIFTTLELQTYDIAAPTNVYAKDITTNSATIYWKAYAESYNIKVNNELVIENLTAREYTFTDLLPGCNYSFKVCSNVDGESSDYVEVTANTSVANLVASEVTSSTATITWEGTGDRMYVLVRSNGTVIERATLDNGERTYLIENLTPNTTYYVTINPAANIMFGGGSTVYFTTLVTDPTYVDLGLPSGTLWATVNEGAADEYSAGDYFAIGDDIDGAPSVAQWEELAEQLTWTGTHDSENNRYYTVGVSENGNSITIPLRLGFYSDPGETFVDGSTNDTSVYVCGGTTNGYGNFVEFADSDALMGVHPIAPTVTNKGATLKAQYGRIQLRKVKTN